MPNWPAVERWFSALGDRHGWVLHLEPGRPPLGRVDGGLVPLESAPVDAAACEALLAAGAVLELAGAGPVFVHRVRGASGPGVVLRRLRPIIAPPAGLSAPPAAREAVAARRGLVLVTGPGGAGKSAWLGQCAAWYATEPHHALVVGDPLEWWPAPDAARVSRCAVGVDAPDATAALRGAQAHDVDAAFIDPLGDPDAVLPALELAANGRWVVAAVTAPTLVAATRRLLDRLPAGDRDVARQLLAETLALGLELRLVDRADGAGRVPAHGVCLPTPAVRNLLREDMAHQLPAVMTVSQKYGMQDLGTALAQLAHDGTCTPEAARAAAPDGDAFDRAATSLRGRAT